MTFLFQDSHEISDELILNLDQISSKFAAVKKEPMDEKG